ncbi:DUF1330 domain-containing protein [Ensifer sp. ENS09]|uniref:DUF1330 domain-containing protein n=1 Tax=Ensifer sp. ENS09 TaxID=2769263 RepID=UPI00178362A3|nr:DUF1330 domain-containing protein [Ensifer sp. ENS09]MBD9652877.1 DUF1330 domain-containing protein [Ensifer sp. ENS09]
MTSFAVATLRNVTLNEDAVTYLERIDETLKPYEGRFIIHGGEKHVKEGAPDFDLIVLRLTNLKNAEAWYRSADYQAILGLRVANSQGEVFLIDGVPADPKATDILTR